MKNKDKHTWVQVGAAVLATAFVLFTAGYFLDNYNDSKEHKAPVRQGKSANPDAELDDAQQGAEQQQGEVAGGDTQQIEIHAISGTPIATGEDKEQEKPDLREKPEHITQIPQKKTVVSEFSTWYGSSSPSRCSNIERAAQLINGTVIAPGAVFSCAQSISPITEENGYKSAGTYVMGKVEQGIGGGVCQVSTTLYNAALYAGLTIVERAPHSMAVGYVEPARDAAIAGDYKDLKLRNDFDGPVMIEALTQDGTLYFRIHTSEEEIGNEVELISVVLEEIAPGEPVLTVDEALPADTYQVTQKAHTGYVAELYRVIRRDGREILREKINTSRYSAAPEYATVGPGFE